MMFTTLVRAAKLAMAAMVVSGAVLAAPGGAAHAAGFDPCTAPTAFVGTERVFDSSCDVQSLLLQVSADRAVLSGIAQQQAADLQRTNLQLAQLSQKLNVLRTNNAPQDQIEAVKAQIDQLTTQSQRDLIRLQGTINKSDQSIDLMTNLVKKLAMMKISIIGNIR